jgi:hypothetical protein
MPKQRKSLLSDQGKKPYTEILGEPMPKWTALTQPTEKEIDELIDEKFKAVFAHYEIDPADAFGFGPKKASAWANLAWHLAREHVPGFRGAPRKRGKPALRKEDDVFLVMHVELLRRRDGLSDRKAIEKIAAGNLVSGTEDTVRKRYTRAKEKFRPMATMFDNVAAGIGEEAFLRALEDALSGGTKKKHFCLQNEYVVDGGSPRTTR